MKYPFLDDNDTLLVNKQLACAVGLNNSVVLRQVHYWLCLNQKAKSEKHFHDDCWWTFNTYDEWTLENFPFWSMDTVRRSLVDLETVYGIVEVGNYNARRGDQTKWYTINYERYEAFIEHWKQHNSPKVSDRKAYKAYIPIWQLAMGNIASCIGQYSKLHRPLPEIISEITQKELSAPKSAERKPRKQNPMFNAVAEYIFGIKPEQLADTDIEHAGTRIGAIVSWLDGKSEYARYGKKKTYVGFISSPAHPDHVRLFAGHYKSTSNVNLPYDLVKFVDAWRKWASQRKPKTQPVQPAAQSPTPPSAAPVLSPDERARLADEGRRAFLTSPVGGE